MIRRLTPVFVQLGLGLGLALIPFFRVAGYKTMLIVGLISTLTLALAWLTPQRRAAGVSWRGGATYVALSVAPAMILMGAGLAFTKGCEVGDGLRMMLVGLLPGAILSYVTLHAVGRRWAYALVWFGLLALAGQTFLSEPVYRVDHPFIGMLLGPPNEKPEILEARALYFALEVLLWAGVVGGATTLSRRWRERGADVVAVGMRLVAPALVTLATGGALTVVRSHDAELGYRVDRSHLQQELRDHQQGAGLTHFLSPKIPSDARPWLILDAEFERAQQRKLLGLTEEQMPPATVFWYASRNEKRDLTGAGRTKFAKVHLGEFAVTAQEFPARTLNHEMSHVTSAAFSDGPLRVPGALGGIWYNPLLVEGFAVAVAWTDYPLSAHEQARIAVDKGRAPSPGELASPLGFATNNLSVAYRVSGSFVRFCMETYGVPAVLAWYRSEDFEGSIGVPMADAEARWREMLAGLTIRGADRAGVDSIQSRPPISKESCGTSQEEQDLRSAIRTESDDEVARILGARPEDAATWFAQQSYRAQRANYRCELPEPSAELAASDRRRYAWMQAVSKWAQGNPADATTRFAKLEERNRRASSVVLARALVRDGHPATDLYFDAPVDATHHYASRWAQTRHPLLGYQLAVNLSSGQRWESLRDVLAQLHLEDFDFVDDEPGTILLKLDDMRGKTAVALRDWDEAQRAFGRFRDRAPTQGRRAYADTWLARIAWFRAHEDRLQTNLPRL